MQYRKSDPEPFRPPPRRAHVRPHGEAGDCLELASFAEGSDDVCWLADAASGRLLYVSPRFEQYWGVPASELLADPRQWNDAVDAADAHLLPMPFCDEPQPASDAREYRIHGKDGRVRWMRDRRFSTRDAAGEALIGGTAEDITERRAHEMEREALLERERAARAAADDLASTRDEFLAVVTHELRSPLNAIRGWAHVLRKSGVLDTMQEKALDAIDRNTQAQARLVDDLLDSQRILCGNLQLSMNRLPLATVLDEAVDNLRPTAQAKGIRLEVTHDAAIGAVALDVDRMRQALGNLLSNALKFTPEDGIVQVRSLRCGEDLCIEIADTGAGIEPAQLPFVFERFQQGDSSNSRRQNGLGLGLSLAQQLVALHGGRIAVHSAGLGHGTTFTVTLPAALLSQPAQTPAQATAPEDGSADLAGKRILIVEDDDDGREILESILREAHARPRSFARAAGAYDFLAHAPPAELPDALISDIAMPDEDGYDFIRRVRALEGDEHRQRLVALALTAFARLEDRKRALGAGFDEHVAKPIDSRAVLRTLARVMEPQPDSAPPEAPVLPAAAAGRRAARRPRAR